MLPLFSSVDFTNNRRNHMVNLTESNSKFIISLYQQGDMDKQTVLATLEKVATTQSIQVQNCIKLIDKKDKNYILSALAINLQTDCYNTNLKEMMRIIWECF